MADASPDLVDVYCKNGKLFAFIDGLMFPLKHTDSSMALMKKLAKENGDDWDAPPKPERQSIATPAAPAPDPKLMARRREANKMLAICTEARERFAAQSQLREQFDVGPTAKPGDPDYEQGEARYLHQLGRTL